jgi:23S rRNA (uracil1939-C5)-methyltransferase
VEARVVEHRSGYLRAELRQLRSAGPDRTTPRCPVFGRCGGCQWQHVTPAAQRVAKAAIVAEQLARLGGLRDADVRPPRAPAEAWGYRTRITLAVDGRRLGFRQARSHALVEIDDCAIADPALVAHLQVARAWVAALETAPARVTLARAPEGVVLVGHTRTRWRPADAAATEELLAGTPSLRGAVLTGGERLVVGDPRLCVPLEPDLALEVPADAFTQASPTANLLLVATVLELGEFRPGQRALDLYCGAGNFSLPLARRGVDVVGVERSAVAVEAARTNAARLGLGGARFTCAPVGPALARLPAQALDAVVLDPPRAGAADILAALAARRAARVLYVSCDPATLARDAGGLVAAGYRLGGVQPIDAFPQTYHVETVAQFVLT